MKKEVKINSVRNDENGNLIVNYNDNEEITIEIEDDEKVIDNQYLDYDEIENYIRENI